MKGTPNRLSLETSPYLLQHAHNPVDWFPWGPEALAKAAAEDKPLLLSVGYAACHWCHVMERESFEDEQTAAMMNELFVSIKVDREERPDIDGIYMDAVQAMNGHGGWPMTVFCTPAGEPFYAGTYFPKDEGHGLPSFRRVLAAIAETWRDRRNEVLAQAGSIVRHIDASAAATPADDDLSEELLETANDRLAEDFDPEWGGFGGAPKFPPPMTLEFLLRSHLRGREGALSMAQLTLDRMADGGMHDQIGGGFHRYSTDRFWHIPHFEKMLYDNAQLARVYAQAWQVTGNQRYRDVATGTLEYLLREMRHEAGGFFSSQDADSEGAEGTFFVWSWDQLVSIAGEEGARAFGGSPAGNWEGTNVLWLPGGPNGEAGEAAPALFDIRSARVRPATDDKILAAWNGLAISAFAEAGRVFHEPRYLDAAAGAADFVLAELRDGDGRLLRTWREGRHGGPGYADDHALVADALLTLYEATGEERRYLEARSLAETLRRLFADEDRGGFFQTGTDADPLVIRPKELTDNAVPSGNSAAALLLRLSALAGQRDWEDAAIGALGLVRDPATRFPVGFGRALCAADAALGPVPEIAVIGDPHDVATRALIDEVWSRYRPNRVLAMGSPGTNEPALLRDRPLVEGRPAAYVCERFACKRPVTDPQALGTLLA